MGLVRAFNLTIAPHVEQKKSTKINKFATTTTSLGMGINGSKEVDFNFDMKETSNSYDFGLDAPMRRCCENRPIHASQMALDCHRC
jgi:hypothetical protein